MSRRVEGLRGYLASMERAGTLRRVGQACSPNQEMAEIAHRAYRSVESSPVLLFEDSGTSWPVAMNLYGSRARMLGMLRSESYEALGVRIEGLVRELLSPAGGFWASLHKLFALMRLGRYVPRRQLGKAPCQEVIDRSPDLGRLPITTSWPHDGGPFITLPMVITRDPESGARNVGMYRMQVIDGQTTGMHWHVHKGGAAHYRCYAARGERMPVAVALGGDPLLAYCATAPLPEGVDEWLLAGYLRGHRVPLVRGVTVDLDVPAEADFIIEGYIDTAAPLEEEGPFGDHTGFYSLEDLYPRFHVTCITSRRDAVYPATVVGIPPMEDSVIAEATERIFLPLLQLSMAPEVVDMHLPTSGVAHNLALVSMRSTYAGQGERVANLFWSAGQLMFSKVIVAVDDGVNLRDGFSVLSALARNVKSSSRLLFGRGPLDVLDHSSVEAGVGGKLFIDARGSGASEMHEKPGIRWEALSGAAGLEGRALWVGDVPLAVVVATGPEIGGDAARTTVLSTVVRSLGEEPCSLLLVEPDAPWDNDALLLWLVLAQVAVERDVRVVENGDAFTLLVDARVPEGGSCTRNWPSVVTSSLTTQASVDAKWGTLGLGDPVGSPSVEVSGYGRGVGAYVRRVGGEVRL